MRELFLALLAGDRAHGYELKQTLEQEFGDLLPALNAGQIYSTLARLERDGLVVGQAVPGDSRRKRVYELTEAGRAALARWIETPVPGTRLKDEFFMKFVVVASARLAEPKTLIDGQRREYLQSLRDLDALLAANGKGPAAELLVEGAVLHLKADLEWLDLIEQRLALKEEVRMTPVLEARQLAKTYDTGGAKVLACAASTSRSSAASSSRSWARAGAASRRCSTSSPASIARRPARSGSTASASTS